MTKRYPNLFLAGAPKCGTTSLYDWLAQHPDIFAPVVKEPIFFGSDLTARVRKKRDSYLERYTDWSNEQYAIDGSTHYFFSANAAEEIVLSSPKAKAIITLRHPAEATYSMYHQLRFNGAEPLERFEESLEAEKQRSAKLKPVDRGFPENFLYSRVYDYRTNVLRFVSAFGAGDVKTVLLDDLKSKPLEQLTKLFEWLEIDSSISSQIDFTVSNGAKEAKSRKLLDLASYPPAWIGPISKTLLTPRLRDKLRNFLRKVATAPSKNPPMDDDTRAMLVERHLDDVKWLEDYLQRDLSHWKK